MAESLYIGLGDETDPQTIIDDEIVPFIQSYFPDWEPNEASLAYILLAAKAQSDSILRSLAAETADEIYRYFGALAALPPQDPALATAASTWTLKDDAGYTIDAGTQLQIAGLDGEPIGFQVVSEVTVLGGDTATATGEVLLEALEPGSAANDLSGTPQLIDQLEFVDSIALEDPTSGGSDGETDTDYLLRLTDLLQLQSPRPILPNDFAVLARTLVAGVHRSVAIDLYNADTEEADVPRCVTVVVTDEDGEACTTEVKDEVDALLQSYREVNFLVFVADPTYTDVDVWFTVTPKTGYLQADVDTAVEAAVEEYLSPTNWGLSGEGTDSTSWENRDTIRINELISLIDQVAGVDYVGQVWLAETGDAGVEADLTLTGVAPLPRAGTVTPEAP